MYLSDMQAYIVNTAQFHSIDTSKYRSLGALHLICMRKLSKNSKIADKLKSKMLMSLYNVSILYDS